MVSVSHETEAQVEARLLRVMQQAELKVYSARYAFSEFPLALFPGAISPDALALVRDDSVWSQLVASIGEGGEEFNIFRFHFPAGIDNSGFVGWLASRLKREFGTGVFVTCGQNSERGGIYDYWGVPVALGPVVIQAVRALCGHSERAK